MVTSSTSNQIRAAGKMVRWLTPCRRTFTKAVATLVSVSFLFPTLAWSFDTQTYAGLPQTSEVKLGGPGSESLAAEYRIPGNLGTMVEASYAPGDYTFVLIQDLHCNAEVQDNIRRMLNRLMERQTDLRLVAVEGGSGIIPTLELAALPDSLPKRAVADYFMSQGKLTGADCLAICDRPQAEVFGAESLDLYTRSLELIQGFSTEENRGILLEIQDLLDQVKAKRYNAALLTFDKKRQAYLRGGLDTVAYRKYLQASLRELNGKLPESGVRDYHELELQMQAYENILWNQLTKTNREKQIAGYQKQLELAERIINVSASRQDVLDFTARQSKHSLAAILKSLQAELGDNGLVRAEDVAALDTAMQQSLQFYQLAEQRNNALFNNALQRAKARGEKRLVIVTGGYHTASIMELIKNQGCSFVTLRPSMTRPDTANNYFELLRNPQMATDLEQMLAAAQNAGMTRRAAVTPVKALGSIATANSVVNVAFRQSFCSGVAVASRILDTLKRQFFGAKYVKFRFNGEDFFATFYQGKFYLGRTLAQLRWRTGNSAFSENTAVQVFRMTATRIFGLLLGGAGLTMLMAAFATGIAVAPAVVLTTVGLGLAAISGGINLGPTMERVLTKTNIVLSAIVLGTLLTPLIGGPTLAEMMTRLAGATLSPVSFLQALASGFQNFVSALPASIQNLSPAVHSSGSFAYSMTTAFGTASNFLIGPLFAILTAMSMLMMLVYKARAPRLAMAGSYAAYAGVGDLYSTNTTAMAINGQEMRGAMNQGVVADRLKSRSPGRLWGKSLPDRIKEKQEEALRKQVEKEKQEEEARHGVEHDRSNPIPGSTIIVSDEKISEMQDVLISNGLGNFEAQTALNITCKTLKDIPEILVPPVDSLQGIVHDPDGSTAELEVNIMDLLFDAKDGKVPQKFVQGVLNGLNPSMTVRLIQKDIKEYIARAYDSENMKWVGNLVASIAIAWSKKSAPSDEQTLRDYVTEGILHEYSHGLILALPAGDIPADRQVLNNYTFGKYIQLLLSERSKPLHSSVVMFKNVLKSLRALRNSTPSETTRDNFLRIMAIEMFCDRFGMYLYENYLKNKIYRDVFGTMPKSDFADYGKVDTAELARAKGTLEAYLQSQGVKLSREQLAALVAKLQAAEKEHVYISKYGDPEFTAEERDFYINVLRLVRHYDQENTINSFSPKHVSTSDPIKMLPMLSGAHVGVGTTIYKEIEKHPATPTGVAVAVGQAIFGQEEQTISLGNPDPEIAAPAKEEMPEGLEGLADLLDSSADSTHMNASNSTAVMGPSSLLANANLGIDATANEVATGNELDSLADLSSLLDDSVRTGKDTVVMTEDAVATNLASAAVGLGEEYNSSNASTASSVTSQGLQASQSFAQSTTIPVTDPNFGTNLPTGDDWNATPIPPSGIPPRNTFPNLHDGSGFSDMDLLAMRTSNAALLPDTSLAMINLLNGMEHSPAAQPTYKIGFDSPKVAQKFQSDLQKMATADPFYAALSGKTQVTTFPADSATGYTNIPADWNGITVLTTPVKPNRSTLLIEPNGEILQVTHRTYIGRDAAQRYLADTEQWNQLQAMNDAILKQMTNASDLEQKVFFLDVNQLTEEQQRLLGHLVRNDVEGYERLGRDNELAGYAENLRNLIRTYATNETSRTSRVRVTLDINTLRRMVALSQQGANVVQVAPVSGVVTSASVGIDLEAGLIQTLTGKTRVVGVAPLATLVEETAVVNPQAQDLEVRHAEDLRQVSADIDAAMGEAYTARNLSAQQLETMIDNMNSLAKVTVLWSDPRLLAEGRMHAREYQQNSIWKIQWGNRAERPVLPVGEWNPQVKTTEYMKMKGAKKISSSLLLAVAAGIMLLKSSGEIYTESKGRRLQLLNYLNLPGFLKALRIMTLIILGRVDQALKEMPLNIRQQVADIQREAQNLDKLEKGQTPESLRYALKSFQSLVQEMLKNRLFRVTMWMLGINEQSLQDMYPEIFMLMSQSEQLRNVVYYVSPAFSIRAQILSLEGGLDPALFKALTADPAAAGMELTQVRSELRAEMAMATPDREKIARLQSRINDLRLTTGMEVALGRLSATQPDSERKLARVLISQLGRADISDDVRQDIFKLLSLITPFQQTPVQIRLESGVVQTTLPEIVVNSLVRNQLLNHVGVFDQKGQPLPEIQRPISYASMA